MNFCAALNFWKIEKQHLKNFLLCSIVKIQPTSKLPQNRNVYNTKGNAQMVEKWSAFMQPFLQWKNNNYSHVLSVCVCV
jgi:hypothetical protein